MRLPGTEPTDEAKQASDHSWMITFSDLSTLLLAFFVLLVSMSSLDRNAFRAAFQNFDASSGVLRFRRHEALSLSKDYVIRDICKSLESIHLLNIRDLSEANENSATDGDFNLLVSSAKSIWIKTDRGEDHFSFVLADKLLFASGEATLSPQAYPVLDKLGEFLAGANFRAYIDGHSDDLPINNKGFASNQKLSLARATVVLSYFLDQVGVSPRKVALAGYGSSHPVADPKSPVGRALNRRVEIIFERLPG